MSTVSEPATEVELWRQYRQGNDLIARDRLFLQYMPWAESVGRSVYRRISIYSLDSEDFVQNAELGLLDAMSRFDPSRGVEFRAYAKPRVRGAVFNGLRTLLQERGVSNDDMRYAERLAHLHRNDIDAFDSVVDAIVGLGIGYLLDHASNEGSADAYAYVKRDQTNTTLLQAVNRLPERLRHIVAEHYFNHVPFRDIAEGMGVTKGRMSQLHHEALNRLRGALRELR
jgi:RNA polymerase sigma factor for flagellar operon FliA